MVTLILRQGENGKQTLLSFPAQTPAAQNENCRIFGSSCESYDISFPFGQAVQSNPIRFSLNTL